MEAILYYFLKVILCSGVMFLYYQLFLKDKTFHHYNRFYLLATLLISLVVPLLKIDYFTIDENSNFYDLLYQLQNLKTSNNQTDDFSIFRIIYGFTALLAGIFLLKFIVSLFKIKQLKNTFKQEKLGGISFYNTDLENAPFSYFKNLFWKNSILIQSDLGQQILKHEMVHIEQKHSYDKLFIEILTALFWFNPIFYLIKKEINLIHEYLADKKALKNSDTKAFARMLLETHFTGEILPGTSPFLNSNLKKRIMMLKKSNTKFSYLRKVLALPMLFIVLFTYLVKAENREIQKSNLALSEIILELNSHKVINDTIGKNDKIKNQNTNFLEKENAIGQQQEMSKKEQNISESLHAKENTKIPIAHLEASKKLIKDKEDIQNILYQQLIKSGSVGNESFARKDLPNKIDLLSEAKFYIDGKESNIKEFRNIDPKNIINIVVQKDQEINIIRINTNNDRTKMIVDLKKFLPDSNDALYNNQKLATGNFYIAPPQRKKYTNSTADTSYTTDENSPENESLLKANDFSNAKIYINGKLSNQKTAEDLDPKNIKQMNVDRKTKNGVEDNEIRITTKK